MHFINLIRTIYNVRDGRDKKQLHTRSGAIDASRGKRVLLMHIEFNGGKGHQFDCFSYQFKFW